MAFPEYYYHPVHGGREFINQEQRDAMGPQWQLPRGKVKVPVPRLQSVGDKTPILHGDALRQADKMAFLILWSPGVTGGEIAITTAHDPEYTGRWARRLVVNFGTNESVADSVDWVSITDTGIHAAIRVEVTETIEGGFVEVHPFTA